ncbi:DUF362 domain-containing protein [Methanospirillum lacunae]|uniref:4Fe-4S ferredoxin n=1 Tax=Methanospirillum lacunae TaxID=668570 RepID=A0A2V2MYS1_9EURY|nr:DUF362 domain-containing protein [Methanospirillum lacunae]PWR71475.1 4Fe-4S ferredoxin [Methanospirillum lacunae]
MVSDVFLARMRIKSPDENNLTKITKLLKAAGLSDRIEEGDLTAVKLHFGELGNDTYIKPVFVRQVVDEIKGLKGKPFLTDTNTMYIGARHNAVDHLQVAIRHGFCYAVVDSPVTIADGLTGNNTRMVAVKGKHFESVKIAGDIADADAMIVLSHVKGHALSGFGGAIKNLAMGCATPLGKRDQHQGMQANINPQSCVGCGFCVTQCPFDAIRCNGKVARVEKSICYGCSACLQVCPENAIDFNWKDDVPKFIERMVEYAAGAVAGKEGKIIYLSFVMSVTPDCDCVPWSDAPIVPDIGFLASTDPVAIDATAVDLINQQPGIKESCLHEHHAPGEHKFTGLWAKVDGEHQIRYGERMGLGSREYRLVEV